MQNSSERIWYLDVSKHANSANGIAYRGSENAEFIWKEYGSYAEEMGLGFHDLTPPSYKRSLMTGLYVHENFHGTHRVDDLNDANRYLMVSPLHYANAPKGIQLTRLPEDSTGLNFVYIPAGELPRLYYMLRWLQSPSLHSKSFQRELVGATVGTRTP